MPSIPGNIRNGIEADNLRPNDRLSGYSFRESTINGRLFQECMNPETREYFLTVPHLQAWQATWISAGTTLAGWAVYRDGNGHRVTVDLEGMVRMNDAARAPAYIYRSWAVPNGMILPTTIDSHAMTRLLIRYTGRWREIQTAQQQQQQASASSSRQAPATVGHWHPNVAYVTNGEVVFRSIEFDPEPAPAAPQRSAPPSSYRSSSERTTTPGSQRQPSAPPSAFGSRARRGSTTAATAAPPPTSGSRARRGSTTAATAAPPPTSGSRARRGSTTAATAAPPPTSGSRSRRGSTTAATTSTTPRSDPPPSYRSRSERAATPGLQREPSAAPPPAFGARARRASTTPSYQSHTSTVPPSYSSTLPPPYSFTGGRTATPASQSQDQRTPTQSAYGTSRSGFSRSATPPNQSRWTPDPALYGGISGAGSSSAGATRSPTPQNQFAPRMTGYMTRGVRPRREVTPESQSESRSESRESATPSRRSASTVRGERGAPPAPARQRRESFSLPEYAPSDVRRDRRDRRDR